MNHFNYYIALLCCLFHALAMSGQTIKGNVADEEGEALIGVTVTVQGEKGGTVSDVEGNFRITAKQKNPVLVLRYVGMQPLKVRYKGEQFLKLTMKTEATMLDEVVAVGYSTMKRRDLTGAVSSLRAKELEAVPVTDVAQALAGRIAGVQVIRSSGAVDAQVSVRVRGGLSITQDNNPLYIIDGVPNEDGLAGLSASDIESIDVLKDASATAIYGSRGANGVVIVTTKSGKGGKLRVNYEMYFGWQSLNKRLDMLSAADYARLEYERVGYSVANKRYGNYADLNTNFPDGSGVDWQDMILDNTTTTQMHRVSLNGGGKNSNFLLSYTRNQGDGIMENSWLKNNAFRLKYAHKANERFSFDAFVNFMDNETCGSNSLEVKNSTLRTLLSFRPTLGLGASNDDLVNSPGDPYEDGEDIDKELRNPLMTARNEERIVGKRLIQIGGSASYEIFKNLRYKGVVSYKKLHNSNEYFVGSNHPRALQEGGAYATISHAWTDALIFSNTLSYQLKMKKVHALNLLLGQEYIEQSNKTLGTGAKGFPDKNFGLDDLGLGTVSVASSSSKSEQNQLSFFLRGDYRLLERYLLSVVFRADGSSKFGKNNRWGYFPSASLAWRINEEKFMKRFSNLSQLKLRLSYGAVGNCSISSYRSLDLMYRGDVAVNGNAMTGYGNGNRMANPNLKWETNLTANVGLDVGLFDNRINLSTDFYHISTRNLLLETNMPYTSGYTSALMNTGATKSMGAEITLNTTNIKKKHFTWSTSFNMAFNHTEVTSLYNTDHMLVKSNTDGAQGDGDYLIQVGERLGQMYGYVGDGIYTTENFEFNVAAEKNRWKLKPDIPYNKDENVIPGYVKFKDLDGDGVITTADRKVIGNAQPLFYGGLNNTLSYKGFDLSVFMNFTYGNDVYNATRLYLSQMQRTSRNVPRSAFEGRFVTVDENGYSLMNNPAKLTAANQNATKPAWNGQGASYFYDEYVEDGSFLRLNTITLGYTFPKKWMKKVFVESCRLYASVYNVCTLTGYSGYDPEVASGSSSSNGNMTPGLDWGSHPRARSVVFGGSITF